MAMTDSEWLSTFVSGLLVGGGLVGLLVASVPIWLAIGMVGFGVAIMFR